MGCCGGRKKRPVKSNRKLCPKCNQSMNKIFKHSGSKRVVYWYCTNRMCKYREIIN